MQLLITVLVIGGDLSFKGQCAVNVNKLCVFRRKAIVPSGPVREVFSHPISVETTTSQSCLLLQLKEQRFVVSLLVPANAITALINDLTCCATDYSGCTCKPRDDLN